ncbi:MAG: 3-hydroxyacyl-[acyl-carrier-protein] dehydratase FabZ [Kordiimonadales bacterium]|nr:MAG: 3-hydroxyacyl-[acyl-carrier-protein] dehydratase FabZ [Kordiimonadales bacterium]
MDFDITKIMETIPHRYPFLLIDKVVDIVKGESAVGIKNVTMNEQFFMGHFPQKPVFPGVLILEAMAQTSAVLSIDFLGDDAKGKLVYFMGIDKVKFRKPVGPGDQLHLKVTKTRGGGKVWKYDAEATVDGVLVAEAKLTAMISDE